ncbi:MAG: alpha/beta hydrolase [Spirochaetaceae bacterium]
MRRATRITVIVVSSILAVLAVAAVVFVVWASNPLGPAERAMQALDNEHVRVTDDSWLLFGFPSESGDGPARSPRVGIVFYPGGLVDHRSYAALAQKLAGEGYKVAIVPAPLNLMVFASDRATAVFERFPDVEHWVLAGHSLGAAMATRFAYQHPELVEAGQLRALVLLAGYPVEDWNLRAFELPVLSIAAGNDTVFDRQAYVESRDLLPPGTIFETIDGGNHAGFGDYGPQSGDGVATISPEEQQQQSVEHIVSFLDRVLPVQP